MGSNFRPRESRGLQNLGNSHDRDSASFSDAPSRPMSYSNVDIEEVGTDNPEMSIFEPGPRPNLVPGGPVGRRNEEVTNDNASYSVSGSRIPAPSAIPGHLPNTPTFSAYRRPIRENASIFANAPLFPQRRSFTKNGASNLGRRETTRGMPGVRNDESSRWDTLREYFRGPADERTGRTTRAAAANAGSSVGTDSSLAQNPVNEPVGTKEVPRRRDFRGNPVNHFGQYNGPPLNSTHNQRRAMTDIYADSREAGFEVPSIPKLLPARDIYMAFAHYFEQIAPLPETFSPEPGAVIELSKLLDYGKENSPVEATSEPLTFALQLPDRTSTWPIVSAASTWIRSITKDNNSLDVMPELTDVDVSKFNFEQFLEYAEFSAYGSLVDNGEIEPSFETESKASLQSCSDQDLDEITALEEHSKNVESVQSEVRSMSDELQKQPEQIQQLETELADLQKNEESAKSELAAKQQAIAEVQREIDTQTRNLAESESEINRLFSEITHNVNSDKEGILTMEGALELAAEFTKLQETSAKLQEQVNAANREMSQDYERPAREKSTKVRISIDDYNNKLRSISYIGQDEGRCPLNVPDELLSECNVPRTVVENSLDPPADFSTISDEQNIWGKTQSESLNTSQDPGQLHTRWSKLESFETQARIKVDDEIRDMEAEIPSSECRKATNEDQLKKLNNELQYLESSKVKTKEDLAERKLRKESELQEITVQNQKWSEIQRNINQLNNLVKKLNDEKKSNETRIQEMVPCKQRIEEALLDHQTARKVLADKIEELTEATEKMKPASESAQQLIANLTPDHSDMPPITDSPHNRASKLMQSFRG